MEITVRFAATLAQAAGMKEMTVNAVNVKALLVGIGEAFRGNPEFLRQLNMSNLIVNDTNVNYLKGKRTPLKEGDVVTLFPPLGGG